MNSYRVLMSITHDGMKYDPNASLEMSASAAQPLVELGYLTLADGEQQSEDEKSEDEKPAPKRRRKQQNTDT